MFGLFGPMQGCGVFWVFLFWGLWAVFFYARLYIIQ